MPNSQTPVPYDALDDAIHIEGQFDVSWQAMAAPCTEAELLRMNDRNLLVLNAIDVMDAHRHASDSDENDALHLDVQRIEAKVDLLLDLMNQLLKAKEGGAQSWHLLLTASSVTWQQHPLSPRVGDYLLLDLYIHPSVSMPIRLPMECVSTQQGRFYGISPALQNALDKLIFRQHRRAIAVNKQSREGS